MRMSGTRGLGRIVAMGIGLAVMLLLLAAGEAKANKYAVAQCGWYVGADANWADSTGGAKFRPDAWCVPAPNQDPFDGVHMKSFTRDGASTVSGTRFARWRWEAPPGTGITQVSGTWWHTLHDGMQQRLGVGNWSGGFDVFAAADSTDVTPHDFVAGFSSPMPAFEDRLLCAKPESRWCSLEPGSWSAIRALTFVLEDDNPPAAGIGGDITAGGWRRGTQGVGFWGGGSGSGIRFGETFLDGARVNLTEYPCEKAYISGEWRGTRMRPCLTGVSGGAAIDTTRFSDGPHALHHCVVDFAANVGCTSDQTVYIDNNPPAHPRNLTLAGGEAWRRVDAFDFSWQNPDQGPASPIGGAFWKITGPAGYDSGVHWAPGRDLSALADRTVPGPGVYDFHMWLRDEAGNDSPSTALDMTMRLDNVVPGVAFETTEGEGVPAQIRAEVTDAHSGPASGKFFYRRVNAERWTELLARFQPGERADEAQLVAQTPNLEPGTYVFRAEAVDGAGNTATTTRRADGTEMAIRVAPPPVAPQQVARPGQPGKGGAGGAGGAAKDKTRIFARLRWGRRLGTDVTVPFGRGATLSGRLVRGDGAGVAGRALRVVARPSRGALAKARVETVTTGDRGGFRLALGPGPSRRITVGFEGDGGLDGAERPSLLLRVQGGMELSAAPLSLRNGQAVRLSGRVLTRGAPVPRRGKLVAIQYLEAASGRWRPVLVTRTDHHGRFRARYRFRYVTGAAAIRLRAVALPEERWPYAPGASRPVTVHVTG
jgi:hypothetical protein